MAVLDSIAAPLRTFVEPQIEQLGLDVRPQRFGLAATFDDERGSGALWAASLGSDCLVTSHRVVLARDMLLSEYPADYGCLSLMSQPAVGCLPLNAAVGLRPAENLVAFVRPGGREDCLMEARAVYESVCISLTPPFFSRLKRLYPADFSQLADEFSHAPVNDLAPELRPILRSLTSERANRPGADLFFRAKVYEAVSAFVAYAAERGRAVRARGDAGQARTVDAVRRIVDERLGEPLTLDAIAREVHLSRSRLCAAFSQEMGESLGSYIRAARIERAKELLATTDQDVAAVGRAVGYATPASFTEAFGRAVGTSPTRWRADNR